MALASLAGLILILCAILLYQLLTAPPPQPPGKPVEQPSNLGGEKGEEGPSLVGTPGEAGGEAQPAIGPTLRPTRLALPLTGAPRVVKAFGSPDDAYGDFRLYRAVAFAATAGDAVLASADGLVKAVERHPADGLSLLVDHGGGLVTRYAGLNKALVDGGATVKEGQPIGEAGAKLTTRTALGGHLMFEVLDDGDSVDPTTFLKK